MSYHRKLVICSHLLKKPLRETFIVCAVGAVRKNFSEVSKQILMLDLSMQAEYPRALSALLSSRRFVKFRNITHHLTKN